jgi:competence protein ComEC
LPSLACLLGTEASIARAIAMAAYVLAHRRLGGRPLAWEALAFAGCLELIVRPDSLAQPAFQLSYLATAALLAAFQGGGRHGRLGWLATAAAASFWCTLATLPVVLQCFGRLPSLGLLWNLPAGPLCSLALCLGWFALLPGLLPVIGGLCVLPAAIALSALERFACWAGALTPNLVTPPPPAWSWSLWSAGFALLARGGRWTRPAAALLMALPLAGAIIGAP